MGSITYIIVKRRFKRSGGSEMDQDFTHYASENLPLAEDHVYRVMTVVASVVIEF